MNARKTFSLWMIFTLTAVLPQGYSITVSEQIQNLRNRIRERPASSTPARQPSRPSQPPSQSTSAGRQTNLSRPLAPAPATASRFTASSNSRTNPPTTSARLTPRTPTNATPPRPATISTSTTARAAASPTFNGKSYTVSNSQEAARVLSGTHVGSTATVPIRPPGSAMTENYHGRIASISRDGQGHRTYDLVDDGANAATRRITIT